MTARDFIAPPWREFPGCNPTAHSRPSGWAEHGARWLRYFRSLKPNERDLYEDAYPGPKGWESFYETVREEIAREES